jgi:demethylspheroidene O-methyltransferase
MATSRTTTSPPEHRVNGSGPLPEPATGHENASTLAAPQHAPASPMETAPQPPTETPARHGSLAERLLDRLLGWRDAAYASPTFQKWASAFPLTRPIAHMRARRLFDVCAGFVYTQTLLACLRLDLFDFLSGRPRTLEEISAHTGLAPDATMRLLEAARSLQLVERRTGGRFGLGVLGAPVAGNPAISAMIEHNAVFYDDLRDPLRLLQGRGDQTRLAGYWPYASHRNPADDVAAHYSALMAASINLVAEELFDAWPLAGHHHLLDLGGGEGAFVMAAARRFPELRFTLLDLPPVARIAERRITDAGLDRRIRVAAGDFRMDPLPVGADVVTLLRILHDHDDDVVLALLCSVRRTLPRSGTLVIAEPMAGMRGAERVGAAYFALYFQAMGSGRPRSADDYHHLLREAGFRSSRLVRPRRPVQAAVIVATT